MLKINNLNGFKAHNLSGIICRPVLITLSEYLDKKQVILKKYIKKFTQIFWNNFFLCKVIQRIYFFLLCFLIVLEDFRLLFRLGFNNNASFFTSFSSSSAALLTTFSILRLLIFLLRLYTFDRDLDDVKVFFFVDWISEPILRCASVFERIILTDDFNFIASIVPTKHLEICFVND